MNILITGANGMLGEKCTELLAQTHNVFAGDIVDNLCYSDSIPYRKVDITNKVDVHDFIMETKPDAVVNCAAYTNVDGAEKDRERAWDVNVEGVKNIISAISPQGSYIIHISTDYVFDGSKGPYKEDDGPTPINYYGETKLASEKVIESSQNPWTILRTNVLFGDSHFKEASFVQWVIEKMKKREVIHVVNDQFGNPTWVNGMAQAIAMVIEKRAKGIYNYGGLDYVNRFEFALEIAASFSLDPTLIKPILTRSLDQVAERPYKAGLVNDKIKKDLGVKLYTITESLRSMKGT